MDLFPKTGWAVPQLNFDRLDELYDFRVLVEQYAAQCCATSPERLELLLPLKAIWCVPIAQRLGDPVQVGLLDEQFHETLVAASGNREMVRSHHYITEHIRLVRRLDFIKPERVDATYDEHSNILNLIFAGEVEQVSAGLQGHILISKTQSRAITLEAMYQRRQVRTINANC